MPPVVISEPASLDLEQILTHSEQEFGSTVRHRYRLLIRTALLDLTENDERPGVTKRPELGKGVRTYHLSLSRDHVPRTERVRKPRHFIVFRLNPQQAIEVIRVLHDSMDLTRHLPPGSE